MSFNLNQPNTSNFFVNLSLIGTGDNHCDITENYSENIIRNASDYYISIEKAAIPLHSIKLFDDITAAVSFEDKTTNVITSHNLTNIYSVHTFLQTLNSINDPTGDGKINFYLRTDGHIAIDYNNFANFDVILSVEMERIIDLAGNRTITQNTLGASSVLNRIDTLKRVILTTRDLPCVSEFNNKVKLREITSLEYSPQYNFSVGGANNDNLDDKYSVSFTPRDTLVLVPQYARFIYMSGGPISSINVQAQYEKLNLTTLETTIEPISLRPLAEYNIKLQFVRKTE
jgi:hypothetical protein